MATEKINPPVDEEESKTDIMDVEDVVEDAAEEEEDTREIDLDEDDYGRLSEFEQAMEDLD